MLTEKLFIKRQKINKLCPYGIRTQLDRNDCRNLNRIMCQTDEYMYKCCEECLKNELNNCTSMKDSKKCKSEVTCEKLSKNPCFNGGTCVSVESIGFQCNCNPGYSGKSSVVTTKKKNF